MSSSQKLGQIITFYSYKGGVGRTMSLANIAVILAQKGHNVLMIDWDLEAPGLERYFDQYTAADDRKKEGLIEFLIEANGELPAMGHEEEDEKVLQEGFEKVNQRIFPIQKNKTWSGELSLLRAGDSDSADYADKIMNFRWEAFFNKIPSFFPFFAYFLKEHYDYVLIDSRTGHTDSGGVCTMLLPDSLVLAFIPNQQNLDGVLKLAEKAANYRKNSPDLRPLLIYPLPSRIEVQEKTERERWVGRYTREFEQKLKEIYHLPEISLNRYFDTPIQQSTYYAYGEKIAVLDERVKDSLSLTKSYQVFVEKLLGKDTIWDLKDSRPQTGGAFRKSVKVVQLFAVEDKHLADEMDKYVKPVKTKMASWKDIVLSSFGKEDDLRRWSIEIQSADLIVILVSADYLALDSINYLQELLEKLPQKTQKTAVILRSCLWGIYFDEKEYQILPSGGKPVNIQRDRESAWEKIAQKLNETVNHITKNETKKNEK